MAKESFGYIPKEVKKGALYAAEKSVWITVPATVIFVASGAVAPITGGLLIGADVITSHWAGRERRKL